MKTQGVHAHEDRLLDFAYDELPQSEAHAVEQHLQDCARCSETLRGIRGVRRTMARLPLEAEPSAGLDSLLAYAQQSARRAAAGAEPAPRWWRRLMAPALGMAAVSVFGVVVLQVNRDVDLSAALQKSPASAKDSKASYAPAAAPEPVAPSELAAAPPPPPAPTVAPAPAQAKAKPSMDWGNASSGRGRVEKKGAGLSLAAREPEPEEVASIAGGAPLEAPAVQTAPAAPMKAREQRRKEESAEAPQQVAPEGYASRSAAKAPRPAAIAPSTADSARADDADAFTAQETEVERAPSPGAASPAARTSPSPAELLRQAELSLRSGDRAQEVVFLRAALSAGAQGPQALAALSRLCDAETLLGRRRSALEICKRVVAMAPGSSEARSAQRLLQGPLGPESNTGDAEAH